MSEAVDIVLVEDDPGHARLIEKMLRRAGLCNPLRQFADGQSALDHLLAAGDDARPPMLVLLDLNLPVRSGLEVLERLKMDSRTQGVPVMIISTTDGGREAEACFALGCGVFVTKPLDYPQFAEAIGKLGLSLAVVRP
jgi:CheY-like chemotaxis protein